MISKKLTIKTHLLFLAILVSSLEGLWSKACLAAPASNEQDDRQLSQSIAELVVMQQRLPQSLQPQQSPLASKTQVSQPLSVEAGIPRLRDVKRPEAKARSLLPTNHQFPLSFTRIPNSLLAQGAAAGTEVEEEPKMEAEEEIVVEGQRQPKESTPQYTVPQEEVKKQGSRNVAEILKNLPGFAVNDVGFGADIHTGTFYRGSSINQSVFLVNGRSIGSNISTYHGATDLNGIPAESIDRVELSSGLSSTLYGSEAFGGVVNIITKPGSDTPKFSGLVQLGSYGQENYRGTYRGSAGSLRYSLGYEKYQADNRYRVPVGAANRGSDGRLFNADQARDNYSGQLAFEPNHRNTFTLDAFKTTSRKGLIYFGFPLQRDRLNHDALNLGLGWRTQIGAGQDSTLSTTIGYNQDYFSTFGPTQNVFYRQGNLDSKAYSARVEHDWQVARNYRLRWGLDLQDSRLRGDVISTNPRFIAENGTQNRDRFNTALFAANSINLTPTLVADLGLRQSFNSEFGNQLNPSTGLRWDISPTIALRGNWTSVRRLPGLDQLYVFDTVHNWLPNPDLKPETGSAWTAGVDAQLATHLKGQLTYFGNRLNDRISVQNGRWANIGLVNTNGIEAALKWQISSQWSTFTNYTYTDAKIASGQEKGLQLGTVPFSVAQAGVGYESNGWQVNLYANYFSGARRALFTSSTDSPRDFSPAWLSVDLSARIPVFSRFGLLLYLENLGGVAYEKVNRLYQPGLTFRAGLSADF